MFKVRTEVARNPSPRINTIEREHEPRSENREVRTTRSLNVIPVPRNRIDDGDLLHGEIRRDLDAILVNDQHLLDAHAPAVHLPVLRFEREDHSRLDLN